ncbi:MAG: hypothetical protein AB1500_12960 [Bacillota bacterium]
MLYAVDGRLTGAAGPDKFRIKIWSENPDGTENVVYDNQTETELGGGSIVIHK